MQRVITIIRNIVCTSLTQKSSYTNSRVLKTGSWTCFSKGKQYESLFFVLEYYNAKRSEQSKHRKLYTYIFKILSQMEFKVTFSVFSISLIVCFVFCKKKIQRLYSYILNTICIHSKHNCYNLRKNYLPLRNNIQLFCSLDF